MYHKENLTIHVHIDSLINLMRTPQQQFVTKTVTSQIAGMFTYMSNTG